MQLTMKTKKTGRFERYILNSLSRIIHCNAAGYANNVLAKRHLYQIQASLKKDAHKFIIPSTQTIDFLDREGYLIVNPGYDKTLLTTIREKAEKLFSNNEVSIATGRNKQQVKPMRVLSNPLKNIPELKQLLTQEIEKIICAHYRSYFKVDTVRMWRNCHMPDEIADADHYSNLWHNDYNPVTSLRYFVYLTYGVNKETGALRFHPASHTRKIIFAGYFRRGSVTRRALQKLEDPNQIIYFEGGVGAACIMNPQRCLHRAGVPCEGSYRDIVQFTLVPSNKSLDSDWVDKIEDDHEIP